MTKHRDLALFLLILAPAYLNDLIYMSFEDTLVWLGVDYGSRLFALGLILLVPSFRRAVARSLSMAGFSWRWVVEGALALGVIVLFDATVWKILFQVFGGTDALLFRYPVIEDPALRLFDLTLGLMFVAVMEEAVNRSLFRHVYEKYAQGTVGLVLVSALVFAFMHWGAGPANIVGTFFSGIIFMVLYLRLGSILPGVVVHYIYNLMIWL